MTVYKGERGTEIGDGIPNETGYPIIVYIMSPDFIQMLLVDLRPVPDLGWGRNLGISRLRRLMSLYSFLFTNNSIT